MITPPALQPGDTIGIMAPSSRIDESRLEDGIDTLKNAGHKIFIHPQTYNTDGPFAGTPADKANAFHDLIKNDEIKAIICARGGNGASAMRQHLDFDLIRSMPKIIMGYSDVTALLNPIAKKTDLVTFHGPLIHNMKGKAAETLAFLYGKTGPDILDTGETLKTGTAVGPAIGGNLSLVQAMIGTDWLPDTKGAVLFLEDCNDEISRYDRMFQHLKDAGILSNIAALVVGEFTNTTDTGGIKFDMAIEDVILRHIKDIDIPIITNAPFGHGKRLSVFPVGAPVKVEAGSAKSRVRVTTPLFAS